MRADFQALHKQILEGRPAASAVLFEACRKPLLKLLNDAFGTLPGSSAELLEDAAVDAFMQYLKAPEKYDATRGAWITYLFQISRSRLLRLAQRENRHLIALAGSVELDADPGYSVPADERFDPQHGLEQSDASNLVDRARESSDFTQDELRVLDLMKNGERSTKVFAQALAIEHLPLEDQRVEVKRVKDRIKKRIDRSVEDV
jgi:RNA polymerase sigma-70 factor (ECF subfamily)